MFAVLPRLFPFLGWLKSYRVADLKIDAAAGLTVALVLMPQSMASAQIAGLPAFHGLYAALVPAVVAGLWGSSRQMVTGITSVIAIMAAAALANVPVSGPADYIAHMALLTLMVGGLQLLLGMLRMGVLVNFLSMPVISGFINAAALIIAMSQFGKLLGVSVESSGSEIAKFFATLDSAWHYAHWPSIAMAGLGLAVILFVRRFVPGIPAVLAAVVVTTTLSWATGYERQSIVNLEQVQSTPVRNLVMRLKADLEEMQRRSDMMARIARDKPDTKAQELQQQARIMEQSMQRDLAAKEAAIVREALRRTFFVSQLLEDGTRRFFVKPGGGPEYKAGSVPAAPALTGDGKGADLPPVDAALPDPARLDGRTWRIRVGGPSLDPHDLRFTSGGDVVGAIPSGLPHFSMPSISPGDFLLLFPQALIIAFVAFAESISIAKSMAAQKGYRLDANQELVGQGLANIAGGLVLTCPVCGSFSSSAVNFKADARTGLSPVFAGLAALAVLFFFTGALYHLPESVLAIVVIQAVGNLIHIGEFKRAWLVRKEDGAIAVITFAATLFFAPHLDYGIAAGIVLSLAGYFYRSMRPHIATLSTGPDNVLRDADMFGLEECRHIAIVHFQGALFFANAGTLENYLLDRLEKEKELRHIHLVCSGITSIDASGEESLAMLVERAHKLGVGVSFSSVVGQVADVLDRSGVLRLVGAGNIFLTPREAVCAIHRRIKHDAKCEICPLTNVFCRKNELRDDSISLPNPSAPAGGTG